MHKDSFLNAPRLLTSRPHLSLAALLLVTACGQTSFSAEEHVAQAQQAYAEGDLRTAIIEIKNALQQDPSQAEARRLLGEYSLAAGNAVEAEAELVRAQDLGADPEQLRLPLLRAWLMQGKADQVIDATAPGELADSAQQLDVLTLRGQALLTQGRTEDARSTLEEALELEPANAEALLGMAWVELLEDDREASRGYLQAALDHDPESDRAWELLGDLERDAGQLEDAEEAYGKAVDTTNLPFTPRFKRALTRIFQQDYEGAEEDLQALRQLSGENPAVSYVGGMIAFYQQDYENARTALEEALSREPNYMPAMFYLGATQYALENWQQAESYLNRYTRQFPSSPEANRLLALTRLRDGDSERAERALNAVLETHPEDRTALAMMSNLYLTQGRADEALHHLRKVIAMEPDSAATRAQLGLALMQEGQREEAFSELEHAIELAPAEKTRRLEIAIILERLRAGEHEQALERLERMNERDALTPVIYYNLKGLIHVSRGDTDTAKAIFREGLDAVEPEQKADLTNNLASLIAREGQLEEAQDLLTKALEETPEQLPLMLSLARLRAIDNDLQGTQALLEQAISAHPQALQPQLALAELYLRTNRANEALTVLRNIEQEEAERPARWLSLMATALLNTGDRDAAVETLHELHEQRPDNINVSLMLGRLLVEQGDRTEARSMLEQALEQNPERLDVRLTLVELLTLETELDEATELLAPAQATAPDNPQVLARAGAIAFNQGRLEEAMDHFRRGYELAPNDRYLAGALAQAQHQTGDSAAAVATLGDWLEKAPQDQQLRLLQATLLLGLEREQEAIDAYQRYLESGQENALVLNNLAWLLRDTNTTEAMRLIERAADIAPESGEILDTKGVIQIAQGNYPAAIATFKQALEFSPNLSSIRLNLAEALIADSQTDEAREQLERLLTEDLATDEQRKAESLLNQL